MLSVASRFLRHYSRAVKRGVSTLIVLVLAIIASAADPSTTLVFKARDAIIEGGGRARFENGPAQQNIGVWDSTSTVIRWTNAVAAKGTFRVKLVYSCSDNDAGSSFEVSVGSQRATGVTSGTHGWTNFVELDLGPVILRKPGLVEVSFRVTKIVKRWGINVRELRLVPDA